MPSTAGKQDYSHLLFNPAAYLCLGCGVLVGDRAQHDQWHNKTRSIV